MAVPKRKTSRMQRGHRNSHRNSAPKKNVIVCSITGDYILSHTVSPAGFYNGKRVLKRKEEQ